MSGHPAPAYGEIALTPEVLAELRSYQAEVGAHDYSSAVAHLLRSRGKAPPAKGSPRFGPTRCRHRRCAHRFERDCNKACSRPGRPRRSP